MNKYKLTGMAFLVSVFAMFVLILSGKVVTEIEQYYSDMDSNGTWDALEQYPFEGNSPKEPKQDLLAKIEEKITSLEEKIENSSTMYFRYRMPFIFAKKRLDKAMGLDMTASLTGGANDATLADDVVVPFSGDSLGWVSDEDTDITKDLQSLIQFGKKMEAEGRNFVFFQNPDKTRSSAGFQDYSQEKNKQISKAFEKSGLDYISPYELEDAYPYEYSEMFYRTDHHWTAASGIWADGILCEHLNKTYGYDLDVSLFASENYDVVKAEQKMVGSLGKKVTEVYTQSEDFYLYVPKYETNLDVFRSKENESVSGDIRDTLLNYDLLDDAVRPYDIDLYNFYGFGSQALIRIHNNDRTDEKHILLIKASFANCMYPYLAAAVEDIDVIDLREFEGSLEAYIQKENPDTVVVEYGLAMFGVEDSPFDFR